MKNGKMQIDEHGTRYWVLKDELHRIDGPAVEWAGGNKAWYLNDKYYGNGDLPPVDYTLALLILDGMSQ